MAQSVQPLVHEPEQISLSTGIMSLVDAWTHFWDPTRRPRLRDRLVGVLILAVAVNSYIWSSPTVSVPSGSRLFVELLCAAAIGYLIKEFTARHVHGNVYRELPVSIVRRLGAAIVMPGVGIFIYRSLPLRRWVLTSPVPPVILVSFLLGSILTLAWLIRYEKRNGPVYIVEETPRAST